jgi:hypothetical protein
MQKKGLLWLASMALVALAVACSGGDKQPVSPSPSPNGTSVSAGATTDTVNLKVNAPVLVSPTGGIRLTDASVTLTFQAATGKYVTGDSYTYRVQLLNSASTLVEEKTGSALTYKMSTQFDTDTLYRWRVRAEMQGAAGPWSTTETFRSMLKPNGYIRGGEIYDTLDDGKTVGTIVGPSTWIPGKGLRLDAEESYVEYQLPQTVTGGEYSLLAEGLSVVSSNEDPKLRVMTMREGGYGINDNIYRMSVDKRGNGATAWRFLSGRNCGGCYIETTSSERIPYAFHESLTYFYKATWGNGDFHVLIQEGGVGGSRVYDGGKAYDGVYQPSPHMVFLGSPYASGDRGDPSTVDGMIIRQVWLSANPRPSWAGTK